jgi:hypothetical protein
VVVTPLTGPLGAYGRAGAQALTLWAAGTLPGTTPVALRVHDLVADPAGVSVALAGRPDIVLGPYGSGPARQFAAACEQLWWNHGGAASAPGPAPRIDVLGSAGGYLDGAITVLSQALPGPRSALFVHGASGFGRTVAAGGALRAGATGWTVRLLEVPDPGAVPPLPAAEVLLVAADFATEQAIAARVLAERPGEDGWALHSPWRAAVFVAAGVAEALEQFGARREGLLGPAQWLAAAAPARPDLGPDAATFGAAYRQHTGTAAAYPAAQAFAAGLLAAACVQRAGTTDEHAVLAAARGLDATTLFGRFRLDPTTGAQTGHRMVTVQWQDGQRVPVFPPGPGCVPVRARTNPRAAGPPGGS